MLMENERKSAAMLIQENFGCYKILEKLKNGKWKVQCTQCGTITEKSTRDVNRLIQKPRERCKYCLQYKVGERCGCLELLEQMDSIRWKVKCHTCGKEYVLSTSVISKYRSESLKMCGNCSNLKKKPKNHYPGEIIGCYRLVSLIESAHWLVECVICGRQQIHSLSNLLKIVPKKCYFCDHPEATFNPNSQHRVKFEDIDERIYNSYKSKILSQNIEGVKKFKEWNLSLSEFKKLIHSDCFYCGTSPSSQNMWNNKLNRRKTGKEITIYLNGIDRIDSSKGYTIDNCVSCCTSCNTMKSDLSQKVFFEKISKIYKKHCSETIEQHESELSRVESSDSKQSETE